MKNESAVKYEISFVTGHTRRAISRVELLTYMGRKGFRKAATVSVDGSPLTHVYTLIDISQFKEGDPCVQLVRGESDKNQLRADVVQVATCLRLEPNQVLREIAGEPLTLEDAWNALDRAVRSVSSNLSAVADGTTKVNPTSALTCGMRWINEMNAPRGTTLGSFHHVVMRAAEDLAALALDELRTARPTSPTTVDAA